jgi:hypothetical protein
VGICAGSGRGGRRAWPRRSRCGASGVGWCVAGEQRRCHPGRHGVSSIGLMRHPDRFTPQIRPIRVRFASDFRVTPTDVPDSLTDFPDTRPISATADRFSRHPATTASADISATRADTRLGLPPPESAHDRCWTFPSRSVRTVCADEHVAETRRRRRRPHPVQRWSLTGHRTIFNFVVRTLRKRGVCSFGDQERAGRAIAVLQAVAPGCRRGLQGRPALPSTSPSARLSCPSSRRIPSSRNRRRSLHRITSQRLCKALMVGGPAGLR